MQEELNTLQYACRPSLHLLSEEMMSDHKPKLTVFRFSGYSGFYD